MLSFIHSCNHENKYFSSSPTTTTLRLLPSTYVREKSGSIARIHIWLERSCRRDKKHLISLLVGYTLWEGHIGRESVKVRHFPRCEISQGKRNEGRRIVQHCLQFLF